MIWNHKDYEDKCCGIIIYDVVFANITEGHIAFIFRAVPFVSRSSLQHGVFLRMLLNDAVSCWAYGVGDMSEYGAGRNSALNVIGYE